MDAKLTAYALNELPPDERAAFEAQMKNDPALQMQADEMKAFCRLLENEFAQSTDEALMPDQRAQLVQSFQASHKIIRPLWRRPAFLSSLGLAAAACFAVMLAVRHLKEEPLEAAKGAMTASTATHVPMEVNKQQVAKGERSELVQVSPHSKEKEKSRQTAASAPQPAAPLAPPVADDMLRSAINKAMPAAVPATPADNLAFKPEPRMNTDHLFGLEKLPQDQDKMALTLNGRDQSAASLGDISGLDINGTRSYAEIAGAHADKAAEMNSDSSKKKAGGKDTVTMSSSSVLNSSGAVNPVVASANPVAIQRVADRELSIVSPVAQAARSGAIREGEALALDGALRSDVALPAKPATEMISGNGIASAEATKSGSGNWTLNGGNTYTGSTTVSAGTLTLSSGSTAQASAPSSSPVNAGGSVATSSRTAGAIGGSSGYVAGDNKNDLAFNNEAAAKDSGISNAGSGTLTLRGANTFSGGTTINGGKLETKNSFALGIADNAPASPVPAASPPAKVAVFGRSEIVDSLASNADSPTVPAGSTTLVREKDKRDAWEESPSAPNRSFVASTTAPVSGFNSKLESETESRRRMPEDEYQAPSSRISNTATYRPILENPFTYVAQQPLSTFSLDVDTASYANVRRFLNSGQRPPPNAVRLEELVNYFPYHYEGPGTERPIAVQVDLGEAPWQPLHRLARVAVKAREVKGERPAANFVFLLDLSGSMEPKERLPLIKKSLNLLVDQLREDDRVAIVTYAGESGLALKSTTGDQKEKISHAIQKLNAGGSTNGASGIRLAYEQAASNFSKERINRVILCTDGDFNVGTSSVDELEKLIAEKAKGGVFLSVLGVGTDNLHDHTMQALADRGNGNYHYLDSVGEARKVLVEQMTGTLVTVAKDVKLQVEFNPALVAAYRLIGYEKRMLAKEDFNNDKKDAGEIGAGHTVTALYEIVPASLKYPDGKPLVDDLRYALAPTTKAASDEAAARPAAAPATNETMTVKVRYKEPDADQSKLFEVPVTDAHKKLTENDRDFQFAVSVAGFGMLLRGSPNANDLTWEGVRRLALAGKGDDEQGWRGEFIQLIEKARGLCEEQR